MIKTVTITLIAGIDTGPFDLYSDADLYTIPFESGLAGSLFVSGYTSTIVPYSATIIKVVSLGKCSNCVDLIITTLPPIPTTTTTSTTTIAPITTTTTIAPTTTTTTTIEPTTTTTIAPTTTTTTTTTTLPVSYAVNVTTNGWASNSEACANYTTIDLPLYSTGYGDVITVGSTILYTDPALTLPYDGGGLYRITSYGEIVSIVIEATGLVTEFGTPC